MTLRFGMFGGTFDPIHLGHLEFARLAFQALSLDRLFFVPAAQNPLKSDGPQASAIDRVRMAELALEEYKQKNWEVSGIEALKPGPSYTVETIEALRTLNPGKWFLLMGSEVFSSLPRWKRPEDLLKKVELAVTVRPGESLPDITGVLGAISPRLDTEKVTVLKLPTLPHSATEVRQALSERSRLPDAIGTKPPPGLQRSVWQFIKEKQLYTVSK